MKLIRVIQSKIVKKDNKYQVQSEKGRNLGTYNTKEEAEKRLKQVEMFKHMNKKSSNDQYEDFLQKIQTVAKDYDIEIDEINYNELYLRLLDDDRDISFVVLLDFDLESFSEKNPGSFYEPPEDAFYEDYTINDIEIIEIDGKKVSIHIPVDSNFGKWLYKSTDEEYRFNEKYWK